MASMPTILEPAFNRAARALSPLRSRWNALEPGVRRLAAIGAVLLGAGFLVAFVWLPAVRSRDALTARLPQLEARLNEMRNQAKELKTMASNPATPSTVRSLADVAALKSIFGADAEITIVADGFRVVIAATDYAAWWDKTGEAISRYGLVLEALALARADAQKPGGSAVAIDMRLTRAADAASATVPQGK